MDPVPANSHAILTSSRAVQVLPQLKDYFNAFDVVRESGREWRIFQNGIFLDYLGPTSMKSYLKPNVFVIDIENKVAAIPRDGDAPVSLKWEEETRVVGDEMTWNEFGTVGTILK